MEKYRFIRYETLDAWTSLASVMHNAYMPLIQIRDVPSPSGTSLPGRPPPPGSPCRLTCWAS